MSSKGEGAPVETGRFDPADGIDVPAELRVRVDRVFGLVCAPVVRERAKGDVESVYT